jgi:cytochrome c2
MMDGDRSVRDRRCRAAWPQATLAAGLVMLAPCAAVPMPAATAPAAATSTSPHFPDPVAGQQLLLQKGCANCHGIVGPGGRQGPDLIRAARGKGAADLLADMWNHIPQMVSALTSGERLPSLSAGELRDLVGYLNFINYLGDLGNTQRGQTLLAEMSCLGCHDLERRGKIGPALIVPGRTASPVGLITDIWNHYPRMRSALRERGLSWFSWSGDDLTDLNRYLNSIPTGEGRVALLAPGDPARGAAVFAGLGCVGCHSPARETSWVSLIRTTNRQSAAENGAALLRHLPGLERASGRAALRPLSQREMADLLAYLSLAGSELLGGDPVKGKAAFEQRRCSECHAEPGGQSGIGPDVEEMPPIADPYVAASLMLEHARNMRTATELREVPWPQVGPEELQNLYAYLSRAPRK